MKRRSRLLRKLAQAIPEWEVGSPGDLTFRAMRRVAALKNVGQLRPAILVAAAQGAATGGPIAWGSS